MSFNSSSRGGKRVRALVRDPVKAKKLGTGFEIVVGDLARPETLGPAFAGVEKAFVLVNGVDLAALEANAFEAARDSGVQHIVKISGRHLDAEFVAGAALGRMHNESESRLRGLETRWTILRPGLFASNFLLWLDREKDALFLPVGEGWDTPTDARDIAAVAVHVLTTPGHDGTTYEITGPERITYAEAVRRMAAASGRPLKLVDVPKETLRAGLLAAGVPSSQADALLSYFDGVKAGQVYPPTATVSELLGRPARSFDDWLRDNAAALRGEAVSTAH